MINDFQPEDTNVTLTIDGEDFHLGYSRIAKYIDCPNNINMHILIKSKLRLVLPHEEGKHTTLYLKIF